MPNPKYRKGMEDVERVLEEHRRTQEKETRKEKADEIKNDIDFNDT